MKYRLIDETKDYLGHTLHRIQYESGKFGYGKGR